MEIRQINFEEIQKYKTLVAREHVSLTTNDSTDWYGAFIANKLVGFTAIMYQKNHSARFKGTYVFKPFRQQGISTMLNDYMLQKCKDCAIEKISAYTTPLNTKWYLKKGFTVNSVNKSGISYVTIII